MARGHWRCRKPHLGVPHRGLLTAFFWYPTLSALRTTERFQKFHQLALNPADHGLSWEWQLPLVAPNALGNPVDQSYEPPRGTHPAVLNDYGEVASSYAGLLTLALALTAPFVARRRPLFFALGLMVFAFLTAEVPGWRDAIRAIPLAGVSLHQRLRVLWDLGVCIAAAMAADALFVNRHLLYVALFVCAAGFGAIYFFEQPSLTPLGYAQLAVPVATWRYNPPASPEHVYPATSAITFLRQHATKPSRVSRSIPRRRISCCAMSSARTSTS